VARLRVAVDTGGTFTDFVVLNEETGALEVFKVPSTRGHEADGIIDGLRGYIERSGAHPGDVGFFAHGTTVGTNGLLESKGARTGLIVTEGFRGVYEIGEQSRPYGTSMYDLFYEKLPPLVPPRLTEEVRERIEHDGSVLVDFDETSARHAIERLSAHGVESAAVCLLFSFRNGDHERRIRALFAELAPHIDVSISCEVAPEIREYYRLSTAVVNAYLNPLVRRYIEALGARLTDYGTSAKQSYVMRSNGGVATFAAAATRSVQTILSGPAAGVVAASRTMAASPGVANIVTFDMGGTSTDVALIQGGEPVRRTSGKVHGRDVLVPMLDIHTVAAGGGTLAWIDVAGSLRVGPQSAGAAPGPASYGRGGSLPTVTDANVVLGYLSSDNALAGGSLTLDRAAAEDAIRRVIAEPLGLSVVEAARGIVEIVNVQMEEAIKVVSSNRGYDLREFHLLAYGGAGPLHAGALARDLGMRGVIVPVYPGAFSALGLLLSDVRGDAVISDLVALDRVTVARLRAAVAELQQSGERDLLTQGFAASQLRFEYAVDLRYIGQGYELTIPVPALPETSRDMAALRARFDEAHALLTGHAAPDEGVELVNVRVTSIATVPQASIAAPVAVGAANDARFGERDAFLGETFLRTPVYARQRLASAAVVDGPAILVQDDSTTLVHPGQTARVIALGQLEISTPAQTADPFSLAAATNAWRS
jgi:N-methylhydantoinase A